MGVEGEEAYPYFVCEIRDPRAKGGNVGLEMLDIGLAGSSSSIEHMEIRLLSMWMFAFSLSAIHLNTYKDDLSWIVRHLLGESPF